MSEPLHDLASAAIATTAVGPIGDWTGVDASLRPTLGITVRPNPAFGRVSVRFITPESGVARVSVYDVQGRRVRQLGQGLVTPGGREYSWDGRDDEGRRIEAGIYYLRGWFNGRTVTTRCTYLGD